MKDNLPDIIKLLVKVNYLLGHTGVNVKKGSSGDIQYEKIDDGFDARKIYENCKFVVDDEINYPPNRVNEIMPALYKRLENILFKLNVYSEYVESLKEENARLIKMVENLENKKQFIISRRVKVTR